jgi:hypothetical protein
MSAASWIVSDDYGTCALTGCRRRCRAGGRRRRESLDARVQGRLVEGNDASRGTLASHSVSVLVSAQVSDTVALDRRAHCDVSNAGAFAGRHRRVNCDPCYTPATQAERWNRRLTTTRLVSDPSSSTCAGARACEECRRPLVHVQRAGRRRTEYLAARPSIPQAGATDIGSAPIQTSDLQPRWPPHFLCRCHSAR